MRITRIVKIRSHRVFRNFKWSSDLHSFGQFNLIYGWNGCGKNTLSSLFAKLEKSVNITEGQVEFEIDDDKQYTGGQLADAALPPVRVFNRDFVSATIAVVNNAVAPIYYLGEDSIEKQAEVEKLGIELHEIEQQLSNTSASKKLAETTRSNDALKSFQSDIDISLITSERIRTLLGKVSAPESTKLYDHLQEELKVRATHANTEFASAIKWLTHASDALTAKRITPFEPVEEEVSLLLSVIPETTVLSGEVTAINEIIGQHNEITDNFVEEVAIACESLEAHFLAEAWQEDNELALAIETAVASIDSLKEQEADIRAQIVTIERSIRESWKCLRPWILSTIKG